ncbi:MAG: ComEC/Rec2 family competence protein, partial [Gammaproteobacteria bacterium]|nr:ComEC/Rec2 family competence protein [Gammaproteobacteria bacterium]
MRIGILAFMAGILLLQQLSALPSIYWASLLLISIPLAVLSRFPLRLIGWFGSGLLWALLQSSLILLPHLPVELEGQEVIVTGYIVSLPEQEHRHLRFNFDISSMDFQGQSYLSPGKVRMTWYEGHPPMHVGEQWQLLTRLKRPYGFMNPGGFDYAGKLFQERIRATGYVRKSSLNQKLTDQSSSYLLNHFRELLRDKTDALAAQQPVLAPVIGLIQALAIGERSRITDQQWQILRDTGTSHLLAISGLHVGLVAGLAFMLMQRLWRLSPWLMLVYPAPKAAAI